MNNLMCDDVESINAIQRRATPDEQTVIDGYTDNYTRVLGQPPQGLHYIMFGETLVAVWLPLLVAKEVE